MNSFYYEKMLLIDIFHKHQKEERGLIAIKSVIDAIDSKRVTVTMGKGDFNTDKGIYDFNTIIGLIRNHVYEGLNLDIPEREV